MSQPLFFVDPETNEVKKVVEAKVVTVEELDEQIAHHQRKISELNVEREKVVALSGNDQSSSQEEQPAPEQPAEPATPEVPAEVPAQAPAEPVQTDTPAPATETPGTVEQQLAADGPGSSENQTATPPISA